MKTLPGSTSSRQITLLPDNRIRSDLGTSEGMNCDVAASMSPHVLEHPGNRRIGQRADRSLRRHKPDQDHGVRRHVERVPVSGEFLETIQSDQLGDPAPGTLTSTSQFETMLRRCEGV